MTHQFPINDARPLPVLTDITIDGRSKGFPGKLPVTPLADIGAKGWNVLRQDLPFPVAVLDIDALNHNSEWIKAVVSHYGVSLCPHGKTTMAPQLFHRQLADGCWGITLSTQHQVQTARHYGIERVFLANQIMDPVFLAYIADEQISDPDFDFYFLVDSDEGIDLLQRVALGKSGFRPFQVLIEMGSTDGRTGCRTMEKALHLARRIAAIPEVAVLSGIEGFEGAIRGKDVHEIEDRIVRFLGLMVDVATAAEKEGLFGGREVLLTAGGSSYFDLVARVLTKARLASPTRVVLRSGCYIAHDALMYEEQVARALERSPELAALAIKPRQALTVWAVVLSRPADDVLFLNIGRRDVSFDSHLPRLLAYVDTSSSPEVRPLTGSHQTMLLYDQHANISCSSDSPLRPGMLVQLGISHPCTTFDKWDVLSLVDDDHNVVGAVKTFF
ncbi:alanine racemase [Aureimonas fodinaquatilis]|nr:alanine racemase [Aureimonas fodinaquatilis]